MKEKKFTQKCLYVLESNKNTDTHTQALIDFVTLSICWQSFWEKRHTNTHFTSSSSGTHQPKRCTENNSIQSERNRKKYRVNRRMAECKKSGEKCARFLFSLVCVFFENVYLHTRTYYFSIRSEFWRKRDISSLKSNKNQTKIIECMVAHGKLCECVCCAVHSFAEIDGHRNIILLRIMNGTHSCESLFFVSFFGVDQAMSVSTTTRFMEVNEKWRRPC